MDERIRKYIATLRSDDKQAYAALYAAYLKNRRTGNDVEDPSRNGLSYMAAQAVRMAIRDIYGDYPDFVCVTED